MPSGGVHPIAYGSMASGGGAEADPFLTPAHELFHAVESGYRISSICGGCTRSWVDEGLADAFAYAWLRKYERDFGRKTELERTLPYLSDPLHRPADDDEAYHRSLFWAYLAGEPKYVYTYRDKKGPSGRIIGLTPKGRFDASLIIRFMKMANPSFAVSSLSDRTGQWELKWLDEVLMMALDEAMDKLKIEIPRDLKGGLFVIYPKYAAWLVGHLTTDVSPSERKKMLAHVFKNGCEPEVTVSIDPVAPAPAEVTIRDLATACLHLIRPSDRENDMVDVTMTGPADAFGRIHMGWNGGVVVPSVDDGKVKTWRLGVAQGDSPSNPTDEHLFLAISNVAEDLKDTVAMKDGNEVAPVTIKLVIKFAVAGH